MIVISPGTIMNNSRFSGTQEGAAPRLADPQRMWGGGTRPGKGITMKSFAKSVSLVSLGIFALGLAACDSKQENAAEDQADAVRASAEATADAMEATADKKDPAVDGVDSPAENAQEDKAAAVRASGEAKADAMEDNADNINK
jgi:hypothetical protein